MYAAITNLDSTPIRLEDGNVHTAFVGQGANGLYVSVDGITLINNLNVPLTPFLDSNGLAWAGFGARTGGAYENIDVLNWTLVPEPTGLSIMLMVALAFRFRKTVSRSRSS